MDSSTQDMARGEAGASPGRAPADEREQGEFLRLFKDFKDNPSLKGDAGFRERVATFLDSLDPVRVASTVVNQNELLRTPSGSRQQLSADAQSQVDFTEAFLAPYALERGMVAKTGDKKAMYKDTYVKPYTAAETEVVRELAEVEARLSTLNPQQEIASGGGRFEAYQQLRERRLALSVEQVDILESRRPDSEKNNPEWLEREAKRALTEVSSGSAPVATTGQEAASSEDLRAALGLMSAEAYFGAGNVSRPAEGGGVKAAGTAAGTVGTMETVGTMGTMGTAAGEEKKREEGGNLPINAMDNSTLNGRLPAEGGGVKAAVVAASEEGGVKAAAAAAVARGGSLATAMAMEAQAIETKQAVMAKLAASASVAITGTEVTPSEDLKAYKKNALEYGKTLRGEYTNRDTGEAILLAKGGVSEMLRHEGGSPAHIQSVAAIPQIIEGGIYVDTIENEDRVKRPLVESYDYYVAGLKIGGADYTVKAAIAVDRDGNRYYDHALTEVEKGKLLAEAARVTSSPRQQGASSEALHQPFAEAARITNPPLQQGASPEALLSEHKDKRLILILQAPVSFRDKKNIKNATGWERGADGEWQYDALHAEQVVAAGGEKKRGAEKILRGNEMENTTLDSRLPAEGGAVKAAAAAAVAEQDISYAALARRWHEKDIASAVGFVGQSRQVDVGAPEAVRQLSFLEAHNNLLTREEATVVKLHVSEAALREQFPFLHERVSRQGKDFGEVVESACRSMEAITQEVKEQRGGQWTFDSIAKAKGYEGEVMQRLQGSPSLSRFHELRIGNNRDIAYQLNQAADISVFVEAAGYKKTKGSTERWPRYEKGKSVLLVTEHNTVKDVKSGESRNLFAFIKEEFPNTSKASDTVHFIATVMKYPESERSGALHLGWQQQRQGQPRAEGSAQGQGSGVKKEFRLSDYRLEPLNTGKNYLHDQRGIAQETLEHPNFKGAILQGNRQYRLSASGAQVEVPRWQNNVVYPFKQRPDAANGEMATLLQQYGEKFKLGDKLVDKVFAPGSGKHSAAWFSNLPAKAEQLLVVENPLDALSHYQLHQPAGALYMATGGRPAAGQLALIDEVCQKHNIPNKRLAFDNDMAGHSFDAQYIAHKTPMYGIKTVPDSGDKEFTVEYRQLKPAQHAALSKAAEKNPNAVCRDDGSIAVRVKTPEELSRCNKYAAKFLAEDKSLDFAKSQAKDFNDDLKAALALGKKKPQAVALPKSNGMKM